MVKKKYKDWEVELAFQLKAAGGIRVLRQYEAIPDRKFSFDFLCGKPESFGHVPLGAGEFDIFEGKDVVLVEVQGGAWMSPALGKDGKYHARGAHGTGKSQERDCEKFCLAAALGYRVMPVTPQHIKSGQALQWIESALGIARVAPLPASSPRASSPRRSPA